MRQIWRDRDAETETETETERKRGTGDMQREYDHRCTLIKTDRD